MKAAVFDGAVRSPGEFVRIEDVPRPEMQPGHLLLRVLACGVCRTDLHIVEGDLPQLKKRLIPGHQIVGEVVEGATAEMPRGDARWRVVDGWRGWRLLVLQTRDGKPLRPSDVYWLHD